jgi:hypothetical protein
LPLKYRGNFAPIAERAQPALIDRSSPPRRGPRTQPTGRRNGRSVPPPMRPIPFATISTARREVA